MVKCISYSHLHSTVDIENTVDRNILEFMAIYNLHMRYQSSKEDCVVPVGLADGCELVVSPAVEVDLSGAGGAVPAGLPASELHTRVPGHSRG